MSKNVLRNSNFRILLGMTLLLAGAFIYILSRPQANISFLRWIEYDISYMHQNSAWIKLLGSYLPDIIHPLAFTLITAGILQTEKRNEIIGVCLFWLFLNTIFEFSQLFKAEVLLLLPAWVNQVPFLFNFRAFTQNGVFDPFDLLAYCYGSYLAYRILIKGGIKNEKVSQKYFISFF